MSDHKATPEQWQLQEDWAESDVTDSACLLELRDRLAAAEQRIQELISANEALRNRLSVLEEGYDEQAARLEAVETGKPCRLEGRANHPAKPNSSPTAEDSSAVNPPPAGGLVEMVVAAMGQPTLHTFDHFARAAILACADWLQQRSNTIDNGSGWAERLREEVGHA